MEIHCPMPELTSDRIGRERDDAGRHRRLLLRASRERYGARRSGWPDIFGLRPAFRQMGKRLAESGYSVLVVNPFYRVKKAPTAEAGGATPIEQVRPLAQALNETTHMTDAKAFIAWLDEQASVAKNRKVGTQGYCMGGPIAFRTAAAVPGRVGAVASFHGGGLVTDAPNSPHLQASKTKAQFLIAIAENDDMRSPNDKNVLKETFAKAKLPAEIEVYAAPRTAGVLPIRGFTTSHWPRRRGAACWRYTEKLWPELLHEFAICGLRRRLTVGYPITQRDRAGFQRNK